MTKRTRSVIIDNTSGKIFKDVADSSLATPSNIIAGPRVRQAAFTAPGTALVKIVNNIGITGLGLQFPTNIVVTGVTLTVTVDPIGSAIQVRLKQGTTYNTASVMGTYQISAGTSTSINPVNVSVASGNKIYADILQVGSVRPGAGLSVIVTYYSG